MPNTTNNTQNSTNALGEITALKSLLADSDYSILKTLEGLLACTSATGIIAFFEGCDRRHQGHCDQAR